MVDSLAVPMVALSAGKMVAQKVALSVDLLAVQSAVESVDQRVDLLVGHLVE